MTPVKRPTHTELGSLTQSPVLFAHLDRMAPVMGTDSPHRDRIARVIPVKRTTGFGEPVIGVTPCWPGDVMLYYVHRHPVMRTVTHIMRMLLPYAYHHRDRPGGPCNDRSHIYEDAVTCIV